MKLASLVVISGTGTEIGKTHVAEALLRAWGRTHAIVGYKPIETGVTEGASVQRGTRHVVETQDEAGSQPTGEDARRLWAASTFHVKHLNHQTFREGVSPHLAARREGRTVDVGAAVRQTERVRRLADGVVVELAGGLFTPVTERTFNAHIARRLGPTRMLLVAPDRLGVLHDLAATVGAAKGMGLSISGVVLSAPPHTDASTGTNAREIERVLHQPVLARFPRAERDQAATRRAARALLQALVIIE